MGADLNQVHGRGRVDGSEAGEAGRFVGEEKLLRHLEVGKKKMLTGLLVSEGFAVFTRWLFVAAAGD